MTRRRYIEMPAHDTFGDCLFAWLSAGLLSKQIFEGSYTTFKRHLRQLGAALGSKWIQDGLRHCAATYHYALYGDASKTAALLGERDTAILLQHHKGLASKDEAEQFYALKPSLIDGDLTTIEGPQEEAKQQMQVSPDSQVAAD